MALLKKITAASRLNLAISGFDKLRKADSTFPLPIKMGNHMQSAVFFDEDEINAWIERKKAARQVGGV